MSMQPSKAITAWLALLAGVLGAHRWYLHGWSDRWAWAHWPPTLLGAYGLQRALTLGQDDGLSWLLLPILGFMVAQACLFAIVYGLTTDERWQERHHPNEPVTPTRWAPVLAAVVGLFIGASVLMATIAFSGQRFFEWQIEEARKISQ